jgi:hypothetical protein
MAGYSVSGKTEKTEKTENKPICKNRNKPKPKKPIFEKPFQH